MYRGWCVPRSTPLTSTLHGPTLEACQLGVISLSPWMLPESAAVKKLLEAGLPFRAYVAVSPFGGSILWVSLY